MDSGLIFRSVYAMAVIAFLLFVLWYAAKFSGRGRLVGGTKNKLITVLESAFVSQSSNIHVVKVGTRFFLLGGSTSNVTMLSELDATEIGPWVDTQVRLHESQTQGINEFLSRLRKK